MSGWTIFLDANNDGVLDAGERSTVTMADDPATTGVDETGMYWFSGVEPGSHTVREVLQAGWEQITPADAHAIDLFAGEIEEDLDFGNGVTLSIDDVTLNTEGHSGTQTIDFTVTLSAASGEPVVGR